MDSLDIDNDRIYDINNKDEYYEVIKPKNNDPIKFCAENLHTLVVDPTDEDDFFIAYKCSKCPMGTLMRK